MKKFKRLTALFLTLCMLFSLSLYAFAEDAQPTVSEANEAEFYEGYELFLYLYKFLLNNHAFGPEDEEVLLNTIKNLLESNPEILDALIKALMKSEDPYSYYFSSEEYEEYQKSDIFYGIGVTVAYHKGYVKVNSVVSGSPAKNAGVQKGDVVYAVDGKLVAGMDSQEVSSLLRGEENTKVSVTFYRSEDKSLHTFEMIRAKLKNDPVIWEYHKDENENTYVVCKINTFSGIGVYFSFVNFLLDIQETNVDKVIFDLRDNPGGDLLVVLDLINWLIPEKNSRICTTLYQDKERTRTFYTTGRGVKLSKIAILVNEKTASASELFAKALQEYKLGYVIGKQTLGKAVGQLHYLQKDGSVISLTSFELLSPKGNKYNQVGVIPNAIVESPYDTLPERTFDYLNHNNYMEAKMYTDNKVNLALEQRLMLLGLLDSADTVFDKDTVSALWNFQTGMGLVTTGTLNLQTFEALTNIINLVKLFAEETDPQLNAAVEYILN